MSKAYNLTNEETLAIARLCQQEQGTAAGAAAEASLMCNRYELYGGGYASLCSYVRGSGWWANAAYFMDNGPCRGEVLTAVADVLAGNRTLPEYVDEHDCLSDIKSISTGSKYVKADYVPGKTMITNTYGAVYTFHSFPDSESDPFGYTKAPAASSPVEKAVQWMVSLAGDDSHGYDQKYRWGEKGDYDCSSAVISAWESAGVPVKGMGATYTGDMKYVFTRCGFADVTASVNLDTGAGLMRGDVLLNEARHTALYIGEGMEAEASVNENGGVVGGEPGDQTGKEILVRGYRNFPWDCVLRYGAVQEAAEPEREKVVITFEEVKLGDQCQSVWILRAILRGRSYRNREGVLLTRGDEFTKDTDYCVRQFQKKMGLTVDGIVGRDTWSKLTGLSGAYA